MRTTMWWLALGVCPVFARVGGGAAAPFGVYAQFEHDPPAPVLQAVRQELTSILSDVGLPVEWRSIDGAQPGETFQRLAVVTFKGRCDTGSLVPQPIQPEALGWTHLDGDQVLPYCEIDCSRIRGFLSRSLLRVWPEDRGKPFGRAVARVMAHELYHIFTQSRHHGAGGVAEANYTTRELMADNFCFAKEDQRLLGALLNSHPSFHTSGKSLFANVGCTSCHGERGEGTARGPSLRAAGHSLDLARLASRLTGPPSKMYRRARDLKLLWPPMAKPEIETLMTYLNSGLD